MKVLIVHNSYQQRGGEDVVVEQETDLLRQHGHEVVHYIRTNKEISAMSRLQKAILPLHTIWATPAAAELREIIEHEKPQVAHFHNTFMLISAAAYYVCQKMGVPVVQTLHNYRFLCPAASFFREAHICEECMHKAVPYPGVLHACYRGSRAQSAAAAAMLAFHHMRRTYRKQVDTYIAPTRFVRDKFIEAGWRDVNIIIKPNFLPDPGATNSTGNYALFVGRITEDKGVRTVLKAWQRLPHTPIKIVGEGPVLDDLKAYAAQNALGHVEFMGGQPKKTVLQLMREAYALIFPSEWYEPFGLVAVEAFACGTPVVGSNHGAIAEMVVDGKTGLLFQAGDSDSLVAAVQRLWSDPSMQKKMGRAARSEFEACYTADRNYELLVGIYEQAAHSRLVD